MSVPTITFVGGPYDGEQTCWDGGAVLKVSEREPLTLKVTPIDRPHDHVALRRGIYERDTANLLIFNWKGWDS